MLKNELFVLMAILFFVSSCKEDKKPNPTPAPPKEYANYSQLKVGNYWVYQIFEVDSLGNGSPTTVSDSCYVDRDTMIGGYKYFHYHFENQINHSYDSWLRDSLHYTINENGMVIFSSEDFNTIFNEQYQTDGIDTVAHITGKMAGKDVSFNSPAGIFLTSDYQVTFDMYPKYRNGGTKRVLHNRYAKGVGLINATSTFFPSQTSYQEKRLLRYHIE